MAGVTPVPLAERIDAWLPQTQCTQCGFPCCRSYAEALSRGDADINQCPPGGDITIQALAELLNVKPTPLNPAYGVHKARTTAVIDEGMCIGCTLCIAACPVDAILGAAKRMHTVIADECTGCELCVAPCPVDCIALIPLQHDDRRDDGPWPQYSREQADRARRRTEARLRRLARRQRTKPSRSTARVIPGETKTKADIRKEISDAVRRARERKAKKAVSWKTRS